MIGQKVASIVLLSAFFLPLMANAEVFKLCANSGDFGDECSLAELENGGRIIIDDTRFNLFVFNNIDGSKVKVLPLGEGTNNPGLRFEFDPDTLAIDRCIEGTPSQFGADINYFVNQGGAETIDILTASVDVDYFEDGVGFGLDHLGGFVGGTLSGFGNTDSTQKFDSFNTSLADPELPLFVYNVDYADPDENATTLTEINIGLEVGATVSTIPIPEEECGVRAEIYAFEQRTLLAISDLDNDGMPDQWETDNGLNPNDPSDASQDPDDDGLTNLEEFNKNTYPNDSDSDDDMVIDGQDDFPLDPTESRDNDGDGIGNNADTDDDNDGTPDASDPDDDNDGVPDEYDLAASDSVIRMFYDVGNNNSFRDFIEALAFHGVTSGCGNNNYCPNNPVTREQMAVFLLRGIHGSSYFPPAINQTRFNDVPMNNPFAAWIEQLAAEGVTSGCGNNNYCPKAAVTRAQMAVFLLRSKYGSGFFPPAIGSSAFNDVPLNNPFAAWIAKLAADGVTSGCAVNLYCPDASVTRAQMAVFLVRTFGLPLYFTPLPEAAVVIQSSQPAKVLFLEAGNVDESGSSATTFNESTTQSASRYLIAADLPVALQDRLSIAGASAEQTFSSADGQRIVFASESGNLVPGDTNEASDIFLYDVETDQLQRVSVDSRGNQADGASTWARMDAQGRIIVFSSEAGNLTEADNNGVSDIFTRDLWTGETRRISLDPEPDTEPLPARHPSIDGSGTEIVYDLGERIRQVRLHNQLDFANDPLSEVIDRWGQPIDGHHPVLSPSGRYLVYVRETRDAINDKSYCHLVWRDRGDDSETKEPCPEVITTTTMPGDPMPVLSSDEKSDLKWSVQ